MKLYTLKLFIKSLSSLIPNEVYLINLKVLTHLLLSNTTYIDLGLAINLVTYFGIPSLLTDVLSHLLTNTQYQWKLLKTLFTLVTYYIHVRNYVSIKLIVRGRIGGRSRAKCLHALFGCTTSHLTLHLYSIRNVYTSYGSLSFRV
jgi:hypothetical protein